MRQGARVDGDGRAEAGDVAKDDLAEAVSNRSPVGAWINGSGRLDGIGPVAAGSIEAILREERRRLAYRIHDGLTQVVTTAILELEGLRQRIAADPEEAIRTLEDAKAEIRRSLDELRSIMFHLSEEPHPESEARESLAAYARDAAKRWRLPAVVSVDGDFQVVSGQVLDAACGVIGESLANAAKHSTSPGVAVRVRASDGQLHVEIEDGGRGFAPALAESTSEHFGLEMMRKRVEEIDGTLDIESSPGQGTRVVARLPIEDEGEKP